MGCCGDDVWKSRWPVPFPSGAYQIFVSMADATLSCGQVSCAEIGVTESWTGTLKVFITPTAPKDDLSIISVSPVQAPDNPDFVVDGKPTIVKAKIKNTFADAKTLDVKVNSGSSYTGTASGLQIDAGEKEYYIDPGTFITPTGSPGSMFTADVEVDSGRSVTESNENNNVFSIDPSIDPSVNPYPIKKANQINILFVPLKISIDSRPAPSCVQSGSDEISNFRDEALTFLRAVYPVKDDDVKHFKKCSFPEITVPPISPPSEPDDSIVAAAFAALQEATWCRSLSEVHCQATGGGTIYVIGVVRDGWFNDLTSYKSDEDGDTAGLAIQQADPESTNPGGIKSAIIEVSAANDVAHEIGHVLGLRHPFDYEPNRSEPPAPGYYVLGGQPTQDPDFMGYTEGDGPFGGWVSKDTFNFLKDKLAVNPADPAVIGISGLVTKDGTALLDKLERFDHILDIPLDNPGEYSAVYMDASGNVLDQTGFDVSFVTTAHDVSPGISVAPLALRIPDIAGTEKIVLKKGDTVLAESTFQAGSNDDITPPAVTVPDNILVEATSADGAVVKYKVTAQDTVDGTTTLEEDGTSITQDDVGGDITISCTPDLIAKITVAKVNIVRKK
jgi:hypothetical protein